VIHYILGSALTLLGKHNPIAMHQRHVDSSEVPCPRNAGDMPGDQVVTQEAVIPPNGTSMQHQDLE